MKNKTLYIHIGTGKTGTTSLQKFLFDNKYKLADDRNLKYAETGLFKNKHRLLDLNSRRHDKKSLYKVLSLLKSLNEEVISGEQDRYLISDEDFPGLTKGEIGFYRDYIDNNIDVKVILYIRRQDEYLESWYNQIVKTGIYGIDIKSLMFELKQKRVFNYDELISRWKGILGDDNVFVKIYQRNKFVNGNIYDDFLSVFHLSSEGLVIPSKDMNVSLTRDKILLIRKLNSSGIGELLNSDFIQFIKKLPSPNGDSKYILSPEERMNFLNEYETSNRNVSSWYFNGDFIFELDFNTDWEIRHTVPDELFIEVINYLNKKLP